MLTLSLIQQTMNVSFSKDELGVGTLTLDFTAQDFNAEYKKRLRKQASTAKIKGFRPGKVPEQLVEKMYGQAMRMEALNDKVSDTINNYLKENKVQILGEIHNKDHQVADPDAKEFSLSYEMALVPEFDLPDLATLPLPKYRLNFTEQEARQEIDTHRKRSGRLQEKDSVDDASIIYAEYAQAGQEPKKTYLSAERMTDAGRGAFFGKKAGETVSVDLTAAFNEDELRKVLFLASEDQATPTGSAEFKIEKIQGFSLPELDQNFVTDKLGVEYDADETQVVKNYQAKMADNSQSGAEYVEQAQALNTLRDSVKIQLPEAFLKHMVEHTYEHNQKEISNEDFAREMKAVRNNLIMDKLAETLEVNVDFEDVVTETMAAVVGSGYYNGGSQDDELRQMAIRLLSQKDRSVMNDMAARARSGKILAAAAAKMNRTEKLVGHQELQEIASRN